MQCFNTSTEHAEQSRTASKAKWANPEHRAKMGAALKKRSESPEWQSALHFQRGEKHPRFNGGKAERKEAMSRYEYKIWRTSVFKRDGYACKVCTSHGRLNAHHIESWAKNADLRYSVDNGITLCNACHDKEHGLNPRKPRTQKCLDCGVKKFPSNSPRCRSCAGKIHAPKRWGPRKKKLCPQCGIVFTLGRHPEVTFCSRKCSAVAKSTRLPPRACAFCGKEMVNIKPSDADRKCCSKECSNSLRKGKAPRSFIAFWIDDTLVDAIETFQTSNKLRTRVDAVRKLLSDALKQQEVTK